MTTAARLPVSLDKAAGAYVDNADQPRKKRHERPGAPVRDHAGHLCVRHG